MSGLNIEKDVLLEIAVIVTDENLNIIAEGPDLIIQQPRQILDGMDEWCTEHHGKSGLTEAVLNSTISVEQAESQVLEFVKQHVTTSKIAVLAGNSVHADKVFLARFMPKLINHLHYRIVDVSTIKELARRWAPKVFSQAPRKAGSHRALEDIKESIAELQHYKSSFFNLEV